jgi:hypothetical protein
MSHSFTGEHGTVFHYNPDLSEVKIIVHKGFIEKQPFSENLFEVDIDGEDIAEFVAEVVKSARVRKLEQTEWKDILGLR